MDNNKVDQPREIPVFKITFELKFLPLDLRLHMTQNILVLH